MLMTEGIVNLGDSAGMPEGHIQTCMHPGSIMCYQFVHDLSVFPASFTESQAR